MSIRKTTEFGYAPCLLLFLFLLPFLYASFFTFPNGDDFARAVKARYLFDILGGFEEMGRAWWKWSGRYTHHFLIVFLGDTATSSWTYGLVCIGNMLLHLVSLAGICRELAGPCKKSTPLFMGLFLLLGLMCSHGTLNGTWYLITDILSLGVASGFTLLYIWSLCVLWNADTVTRGKKIFCIASCIVAAGCYEYSTVMVGMCSLTAWVLARIYRHKHTSTYFLLLVISVVCFLLAFFARGNFRRQTKRAVSAELVATQLGAAWGEWVQYVLPALITPLYVCIAFVVAWLNPRDRVTVAAKIPPWLVLLYCVGAAAAFMFVLTIVHAASDAPISSTNKIPANMSVFVAMISTFGLLACRNSLRLDLLQKVPKMLLGLVGLLVICATPNMQYTLASIATGALQNYSGEQQSREWWITRAGKGAEVTVAPLGVCPYPSCLYDPLSENIEDWPGRHMAEMFHMKSLRVVKSRASEAYERAMHVPGFSFQDVEQEAGQNSGQNAGQEARIPGITQTVFVERLSGGPNSADTSDGPNFTYISDWLFITVDEALVRQNSVLTLFAVTDTSPLVRMGLLPTEAVYDKPGWMHLAGALPQYALNDPAYQVHPVDEGRILLGLPVRTAGDGTVLAAYISFDGTRYYKIVIRNQRGS